MLSDGLAELLAADDRWHGGLVPVLSDKQAHSARNALDRYHAMPADTTDDEFERFMTKLAVAYPTQNMPSADAALRIEVYAEELQDIPFDMLDAARIEWVRRSRFFPTIAELRKLAYDLPRPRRITSQLRLAALVKTHEARKDAALHQADRPNPEQIAVIKAEVGLDRSRPGVERRPVRPAATGGTPTIDDYRLLGLTDADAEQTMREHARILARSRAPVGISASKLFNQYKTAIAAE